MISFKDYAKQNGITYEAVRAQVKRFSAELEAHIVRDGRQQLLDDEAVAFLDSRRASNPVVIYQQSKDEAIESMRQEREGLYKKIADQAVVIASLQQFKIDTLENRQKLEDATAAQERRNKELLAREAAMDEEVQAAVREASEGAQKAAEEKAAQELAKVEQAHQEALTAAQEREDALREYTAALEAWSALSRWKRRNKKKYPKPEPPEWLKEG